MPKSNPLAKAQAALRELALGYPGATEDFPWGDRVVKVNKKVFVFLGRDDGDELSLSVKLPTSKDLALMLPFATPTGYGLGKAGWVTVRFAAKDVPPMDMLREWLDESYRAVAPKKLAAALSTSLAAAPKPAKKRPKEK
jgi:predicted DNA-binding protein (MmcQ/YjbR family)